MSALGLLARAGIRTGELCPHPERLSSNAIAVPGMTMCAACLEGFQAVIAEFHARRLGPAGVIAKVRAMGYSRTDAARFLLQLAGDRLRVRVGLLGEGDL